MPGSERSEILAAAREMSARGILSASGHGNISVRLPDRAEILYTAAPSLRGLESSRIVRIALDGTLRNGHLPPLSVAAARMHLAAYQSRPDIGSVIHSHSPFATAFAVAGRPIECWAEPLLVFGMSDGIPLVPYAPRGSDEAVGNIAKALDASTRALLLQHHGVLAFGASPADAVHVSTLVEEAAQLGLYATSLGRLQPIPSVPVR